MLHEALVILSLSQILLRRIRYHLIEAKGVELGLIFTNFRLGSPLYCFSGEFWGAARRGVRNQTTLGTSTLTLLSVLISLALSPLSAILLTPQPQVAMVPLSHPIMRKLLQYYPSDSSGFFEYQVANPWEELWPSSIGPQLGMSSSCDTDSGRPCQTASWFNVEYGMLLLNVMSGTGSTDNTYVPDKKFSRISAEDTDKEQRRSVHIM